MAVSDIDERGKEYTTLDYIEAQVSDESIAVIVPNMTWDTKKGELATDILHARLRAKYYGAQVITYRPFILKIMELQRSDANNDHGTPPDKERSSILEPLDPKIRDCARRGIEALVHSTTAFHNVVDCSKQRLIVTNIWGTAHA